MALINLNLLAELAMEALSQKHFCESYCYNTKAQPQDFDDALFVSMIKTYRQADNLLTKLRSIHTKCTDFAAGNMQAYIDEHELYVDPEDGAFDPFQSLLWPFDGDCVDDLPPQIEQYTELLVVARSYVRIRQAKDEALNRFFSTLPRYRISTDEQGESVMVPESELPEEVLYQSSIERDIQHIETEHCLDGYNRFYGQCLTIIYAHQQTGDIKACAEQILALYAPVPPQQAEPEP